MFGNAYSTYSADPKELFVHRVDESYGNILKWIQMPGFNPKPDASIMVGETDERTFHWDVTSLVKNWIDKIHPNYGVLLKTDNPVGQESAKFFYRTSKPPQLRVICLSS